MGLSTALSTALSGLRVTQTGLGLVSTNVANAQTSGYTRKEQQVEALYTGDRISGVRTAVVSRALDVYVQRQAQTEASGLAYASTAAAFMDRLQRLFGTPGGTTSLDTLVDGFATAMDALATTPESTATQIGALDQGRLLAQTLNGLSRDVQAMRAEADTGLQDATQRVNKALEGLVSIEQKIAAANASGISTANLLDQRDRHLDELSELMDIRIVGGPNDSFSIFTTSGISLYANGQIARLSFERTPNMSPQSLYSIDPAARTVGTVLVRAPNGSTIDLLSPDGLRSGTMHALAELRDETLVRAQDQLDALAAGLATALGTRTLTDDDPAGGYTLDLSQLSPGNDFTVGYVDTGSGQARTARFVRVDDPNVLPLDPAVHGNVIGIDFSAGYASARSQIAAALGGNFTATLSGTTLDIAAAGPAVTMASISAHATATSLQGQGAALPFFIDPGVGAYSGSLDGTGQLRGFASRITVNAGLTADPSLLVRQSAATSLSDAARPTYLRDALEDSGRAFGLAAGGSGIAFTGSAGDFAREIIAGQARDAQIAANVRDGQEVVMNSLRDRLNAESGVDIDTEMGKLIQLQTAYAANARVMTAVKEMLDLLWRF